MDAQDDIAREIVDGGLEPPKYPELTSFIAPEIVGLEQRLDGLAARVAASESHLSTTLISAIQDFDLRAATAEQARLSQGEDLNSLTKFIERAFTGIDTISIRLDDLSNRDETSGVDLVETAESIHQVSKSVDELAGLVDELKTRQAESDPTKRVNDIAGIAEDTLRAMESLQQRISNNSTAIDDAAAAAHSVSGSSGQRLELIERKILEESTRIDVVEYETTQARQQTDQKFAGINGLGDQLDGTDLRVNDIAGIAEDTLRAMENLQQRISNNSTAIEEIATHVAELPEGGAEDGSDLAEAIEHAGAEHLAAIASLNEENAALSKRQSKDRERVDGMATIAEDTLRAMEGLQQRISTNMAGIGKINGVLVDVESRVDSDGRRIHEIAELTDKVVPTLEKLGSRFVEAQRRIDEAYTAIDSLNESHGQTSVRIAADADRIEQIHVRVDDAGQRIDQFHLRVDETGERLDQLHQRVDDAGGRIGDTHKLVGATRDKIADRFSALEATVVALKIDDYDGRSSGGVDIEALLAESVQLLETQDAAIVELRTALAGALGRIDQVEIGQEVSSNGHQPPAPGTEHNNDRVDQLESILIDAVTKVNELTQTQAMAATGRDPEMASAVGKISNDLDGASVELRSHRSEIEMLNARLIQLEASSGHRIGLEGAAGGGLEQLESAVGDSNGSAESRPEAESKGPGREKGLFRRR